ncbi:zinc ribbon domain-containing protein [Bacillus sp. HMF5848]|uniref:FmdB family zinc ribbon protein n=1 Tax=Bacillus sp. HMF5848 TaxID=2495421 RepID=UPI000F7AB9E0|nr:zinc ribbon domain-containing protein [Bacillus sp. HMF5848]RSK28287.1 zinc ribbon domain-containing protein [Bacillus sp. HMF5848]
MPLFDLKCSKCGEEFQKLVSFSKLADVVCPVCTSNEHERVFKANIKGPISSGSGDSSSRPVSSGFT